MRRRSRFVAVAAVLCAALALSGCAAHPGIRTARKILIENDGVRDAMNQPRVSTEFVIPVYNGLNRYIGEKLVERIERTALNTHPSYLTYVRGGQAMVEYANAYHTEQTVLLVGSPAALLGGSWVDEDGGICVRPIAMLARASGYLMTAPDSPVQSFEQLLLAMEGAPQRLRVGGNMPEGSADESRFRRILRRAGAQVKAEYVFCKDGGAALDLLSGNVDVISVDAVGARWAAERGARPLVSTGVSRSAHALLKDTPTCEELGLGDIPTDWFGISGMLQMPSESVRYWQEVFQALASDEEWLAFCAQYDLTPAFLDGDVFTGWLLREEAEINGVPK